MYVPRSRHGHEYVYYDSRKGLSQRMGGGVCSQNILATSAAKVDGASTLMDTATALGKRPYCADYVERTIPYSPKAMLTDGAKAVMVAFLPVTFELANYLDSKDAADAAGEDFDEEFDVEVKIKQQLPVFREKFTRFSTTTVIKYLFQDASVTYLPLRLADRLTKDFSESLGRKMGRGWSNFTCATRIFKTAMYGYSLSMLAAFSSDIILHSLWHVYQGKKIAPLRSIGWVAKKAIFYSVSLMAYSGGYALGTAIAPRYLPSACALWFDVFGTYVAAAALNLPM